MISVVGAGMVGSTLVQRLVEMELGDVVMVDIVEGLPQGKALDLMHASSLVGYDSKVIGTNDYSLIEGSDVVVITAGVPRKPGMTREQLVATNANIIRDVCSHIKKNSPDAIVIVVTNPLDTMVYLANRELDFGRERVIGMGGMLDSARFAYYVADAVGCSVHDVQAIVVGGHGGGMLPLSRYTTIKGMSLEKILPPEKVKRLAERTIDAGAEVVSYLKKGSAFYAPSAAIAMMVDAIINDRHSIMPCSVLLKGEYGIHGSCTGVPIKLGSCGVEEIMEFDLTDDELSIMRDAADEVLNLAAGILPE